MSKDEKLQKWVDIQTNGTNPPEFKKWTDDDENELAEARRTDIEIGDTAVGRLKEKRQKEFQLTAPDFTHDEWAKIVATREVHINPNAQEDNNADGVRGSML